MGGCCGKKKTGTEKQICANLKGGKKPIFWVIGGPGSGKGTQCAQLAKKYGLAHLSTGDLLRAEVASKSRLGKELNEKMLTGQLVPREIVLDLLKNAMIQAYPSVNGFLIDGYPREAIQGQDFEEKIGPCSQILYFQCNDETMKSRLLKRAETSGRVDDNEETIANRIKVFHEISEGVMQTYPKLTATISGEQDPDAVFKTCCDRVGTFFTDNQ